jgi:hypothetical protein
MQIMREGGDSAAVWQVIADERNTLEPFHTFLPLSLSVEAAFD